MIQNFSMRLSASALVVFAVFATSSATEPVLAAQTTGTSTLKLQRQNSVTEASPGAIAYLRAYAASQGRWVTRDLAPVKSASLQHFVPNPRLISAAPCPVIPQPQSFGPRPQIVPTPCGGGGSDTPPGYVHVTTSVSSYVPYYDPNEEQASLKTGAPITKTKSDPGYDLRVDYSDGTSSLLLSLKTNDGQNNQVAVMHPNGTSTVLTANVNTSPSGIDFKVVNPSVPTVSLQSVRCDLVCRGIVTGGSAIIFGGLAELAFPAGGPWSFRLGAFAGGLIGTAIVEYYTS